MSPILFFTSDGDAFVYADTEYVIQLARWLAASLLELSNCRYQLVVEADRHRNAAAAAFLLVVAEKAVKGKILLAPNDRGSISAALRCYSKYVRDVLGGDDLDIGHWVQFNKELQSLGRKKPEEVQS